MAKGRRRELRRVDPQAKHAAAPLAVARDHGFTIQELNGAAARPARGRWLFLLTPLWSDQVRMKNGDRLTGEVGKTDEKALVLKTAYAGPVTIGWDAIESIEYTARKVTVTGTEAQQIEIDRLADPGLLDAWAGFLDLGLSSARGNARTSTTNVGMNATRTTERDKVAVNFTSIYSANTTTGLKVTTANAIRGGVRYDMNITPRMTGFGFTDLEFDEFQRLDLRFVGGGGLGWKAIRSERTVLDVFSGASLNKELFSDGTRRNSGELLFGQDYPARAGASARF